MTSPDAATDTEGAGRNWAGNHTYRHGRFVRATSLDQARAAVRDAERVRVLGTRHSFNALCDTDGTLLDLAGLATPPVLDEEARTVEVSGATPFGELAAWLHERGWALANLGSLPHISIAGAMATGTHGSGTGNRVLGAAATAIELLTADGEVRTLRRGDGGFDGAVVSLGALGAVLRVSLEVQPTYLVRQEMYADRDWSSVVADLHAVLDEGYSVSAFTRWSDAEPTEVFVKSKLADDEEPHPEPVVGARRPLAPEEASRLLGVDENLTVRGEPGPWFERLPHFRGDRPPSFGDEIQSEFFVARDRAPEALRALTPLAPDFDPHLIVTEIRAVAADDLWLSPAQGRDTVAIHFTWRNEPEDVARLAGEVGRTLAAYDARPHWGKVFDTDAFDAAALYPRLPEFLTLRQELDPAGAFDNDFLRRVLG